MAYHGCSINISNNLNQYLKIIPCGLDNKKVTSILKLISIKLLNFIKNYGSLIGFIGIIFFFTFNLPSTFLTAKNFINISQQISMLAVVAFTMTVVMVMNDFDLSVGSMASLAGIVAAVLFSMGYPIWIGILAALFVGIIGGLFNGFLVSIIGILPFVATLGTLTMFSGFAFLISGGRNIFGRDIPLSLIHI